MAALSKPEKFCGIMGIFCLLLLSYPLIHIFNGETLVAGFPVLAFYIMAVWILAIIGLYVMSSRLAPPELEDPKEPQGHAE
jgi:hypothetical protein